MATVIAGFPGIGKTTCALEAPDTIPVVEVPFPLDDVGEYIRDINRALEDEDIVIITDAHPAALRQLREAGLKYILVYPSEDRQGDYITKYHLSGTSTAAVEVIDKYWRKMVRDCVSDVYCKHKKLTTGYLDWDRILSWMTAD